MNLKDLLVYGRGLEMSDKQAKGIEEHEKLASVSPVQTEKRTSETRNATGVANTTLIKGDLVQP